MNESLEESKLTPMERLNEIARIFANGILRLRRPGLSSYAIQNVSATSLPTSVMPSLDVAPQTVLTGGNGNWPTGPNKASRQGAGNT